MDFFFNFVLFLDPLTLTWCDRNWLPHLNPTNVLDYFADRSNPFYDHTSNNEMLKMRSINYSLQALEKMQGIEYVLLHVQEPILYVIRKQRRHSPTVTTAIANYYIIAGVVYQAPDLQSVIQSKMLTTIHHLQSAFDECFSYARFHPSTDYYWDFAKNNSSNTGANTATTTSTTLASTNNKDNKKDDKDGGKKKEMSIEEANNAVRNMYRVDVLIRELVKKFPPKLNPPAVNTNSNTTTTSTTNVANSNETQGNDTENKNPNEQNGPQQTQQQQQQQPMETNGANGGAINSTIKTEPEDDYINNTNKFKNGGSGGGAGGGSPASKKLKL